MATPVPNTTQVPPTISTELLPGVRTLLQASKIAIEQDRCVMLDYFRQTANGTAFLGIDHINPEERILVKTKDEFTSLVKKSYKVDDDLIVLTENSLYIVSAKIQKRKVNLASLQEASEGNF